MVRQHVRRKMAKVQHFLSFQESLKARGFGPLTLRKDPREEGDLAFNHSLESLVMPLVRDKSRPLRRQVSSLAPTKRKLSPRGSAHIVRQDNEFLLVKEELPGVDPSELEFPLFAVRSI